MLAANSTLQNDLCVASIKPREFNSFFSLKSANENEVRKIIKNLSVRRTCQGKDIPTKVIKLNIDLFSCFICRHLNYCIGIGEFPT